MARRRQRKQRQPVPAPNRIEFLPVELQLTILEHVSSLEDLVNLIEASHSFHLTYLGYIKTVIAHVTQATLGDAFVEACMLQYWQRYVDTGYRDTENESDGHWPSGPYRHIQLKFIHDYGQLAMADIGHQIKHFRRLFTLEDFAEILTFEHDVVKPLSDLFARPKEVLPQELVYRDGQWEHKLSPEAGTVTATERQRINRTLYRFQICCRLYGPKADQQQHHIIDLGHSHRQAMARDFFGHFDPLENEEIDFVYNGLAFQLQRAFLLIRHHEQWKHMLLLRYGGAVRLWTFQQFWILNVPVGLGGMTAGAVSRGLELVQKVRSAQQAGLDEVARVLLQSNPPELNNFLWDALSSRQESFHFREQFPESWTDEFWG